MRNDVKCGGRMKVLLSTTICVDLKWPACYVNEEFGLLVVGKSFWEAVHGIEKEEDNFCVVKEER